MSDSKPSRLADAMLARGNIADPIYQGLMNGHGNQIDAAVNATVKAPFTDESWRDIYHRTLQDAEEHEQDFATHHPTQDAVGRTIGRSMQALTGPKP